MSARWLETRTWYSFLTDRPTYAALNAGGELFIQA